MFQQLSLLCATAKEKNLIVLTAGGRNYRFSKTTALYQAKTYPIQTLFQYLAVQMLLNKAEFPSDYKLGCKVPTTESHDTKYYKNSLNSLKSVPKKHHL